MAKTRTRRLERRMEIMEVVLLNNIKLEELNLKRKKEELFILRIAIKAMR